MEYPKKLRACPYCKGRVEIEQSERGYFKISHVCCLGRVYVSVIDDDYDEVFDTWNGLKGSNYIHHAEERESNELYEL